MGKESNRLDEREAGLLPDESGFQTTYDAEREEWEHTVLPILREMGAAEVARRTGLPERTVRRAINDAGQRHRRASTVRGLIAIAAVYARERLHCAQHGSGRRRCSRHPDVRG